MARSLGGVVMTGHRDMEYSMVVEFTDGRLPHQLRKGGYYLGQNTIEAMYEVLRKASGLQSIGDLTRVEEVKPIVEDRAAASTDDLRNVESQSSTKSSVRATLRPYSPHTDMDSLDEVLEEGIPEEEGPARLQSTVASLLQHEGPNRKNPLRSVGRAPKFRSYDSSDEEDEVEVTEVDEYSIFIGDQSNLVSLSVLPLDFSGQELIASGVSVSTSEVSLLGKSGGLEVMRPITAWKLAFPETGSFHILVGIKGTSAVKRWVKLEKPRSGYKETAEDIFCVAKFLAFLKMDPHATEDRMWNYCREGNFSLVTFCDHLRKQCSLIERYIDLDPALKEADARKILLSFTRQKRGILPNNVRSDEVDLSPKKKLRVDQTRPEDVSTSQHESEEEFSEDEEMGDEDAKSGEGDESGEFERGDPVCSLCDDGGDVLYCDGPCMRSFHARPRDDVDGKCRSLGFGDQINIKEFKEYWFCKNCEIKKHQCYVCWKLGDSDEALGPRRQVFGCDVASCGKFYHPWCVAKRLKPTDEREALVNRIRSGEESFTCPLHTCKECGKGEEKRKRKLNLATCRRCPSAWHLKCLPSTLSFFDDEEAPARAWDIDKKTFIVYCTDHDILKDLHTPLNPIQFPEATKENIHVKEKIPESTKTVEQTPKKVSIVGKERPGFGVKASSSAVPAIPGRSAGTTRPATQHTSENDYKRRVRDIIAESKGRHTERSISARLFLPKIYSQISRRNDNEWMGSDRITSILNGAKAAVEKFNQGYKDDAMLKCAVAQVDGITKEENLLRTFLAPTIFGNRYTSFGRHFTRPEKLRKVVEALQPYIQDEDTIVDFSCGDNSFSRLLFDTLSIAGKTKCQYKNFDIFTPKDTFGFERKDWFNVRQEDCGPGDKLVIGLNPPSDYADMFVSHALTMEPRILVLIVPPSKKPLSAYGYDCYLDDSTTMANKSFYIPGSMHISNEECLEQGNKVPLHFYIYGRKNSFETPRAEPSTTVPSQEMQQNRKIVNSGKLPKRTPQSDSIENIFIPQNRSRDTRLTNRPQRMPNRLSGAMGRGSRRGVGEFRPAPPPGPPPGPPPPSQPRVYVSRPQAHPSEVPPRYSQDEYNPDEPDLFPRGNPRGLLRDPAVGFPSRSHPDVLLRNVGPSRPQNQQFNNAASTSRRPADPRPRHFRAYHETESGGWLEDKSGL